MNEQIEHEAAEAAKVPLVIYHGNCADGFGAAWCFWQKYGDTFEYYPGVYQNPPPDVKGRDVYLVDFSYKYPVMCDMVTGPNRCKSLTVIDHHKTALEEVNKLQQYMMLSSGDNTLDVCFSLENSGAMLAWDFVMPGVEPPQLIKHIQDRDLWRFKLSGTREIQAALFSYPYDFEVWDNLMKGDLNQLYVEGVAIERKHFKDIKELLTLMARPMNIAGYDVLAASLPYTMTSDAGHAMAEGRPFAACYWDAADGRNFSLRSQDDGLDVSEIAKQFGGGGHARAAGFRVPRDHELARA